MPHRHPDRRPVTLELDTTPTAALAHIDSLKLPDTTRINVSFPVRSARWRPGGIGHALWVARQWGIEHSVAPLRGTFTVRRAHLTVHGPLDNVRRYLRLLARHTTEV